MVLHVVPPPGGPGDEDGVEVLVLEPVDLLYGHGAQLLHEGRVRVARTQQVVTYHQQWKGHSLT